MKSTMQYSLDGYIPSPQDDRDYHINRLVKCAPLLPKTYLTKVPLVIFDQEESNMCVACAIATMKQIIELKQTNNSEPFSPAYIYANRRMNDYQGEGMIPRQALKNLQDYGICHLFNFPGFYTYKSARKYYLLARKQLDDSAHKYRISTYYRLQTIRDIQTAIYTLGYAMVSYMVYDCLFEPDENGVVKYDSENLGECQGGHQMLAIGYNETGLIVVNSWSEDYGIGNEEMGIKGGLVIIPYDYAPSEAWAVTDDITEKEVSEIYGLKKVSIVKRFLAFIHEKLQKNN